ncbi:trimeric intracellular cation channel family protein [Parathalassolituus penaei]|uniref:Trimeric intracellular cation channel family protein n=1 Tax=Parathalassolituus penaei TaxID=2997323 RepID=A0A9X3EH48_9GAMM|nr:trimeric intracellular cation channel family protein [Parathalassolituus penaei]MCY0967452.1 trimeric intracellular cation channel family protein [Parathalassolituus penaei]
MEFSPTTLSILYWSTLLSSVASGAAAVIDCRRKQFDLFGVLMVAFCAALGGGTLRDVALDRPVFWIADSSNLVFVWLGALATFFVARKIELSANRFEIPDAIALGLFTVAGTHAALMMNTDWVVASFMGVITSVAGGILRDILLNEEPQVFKCQVYATASWVGALLYVAMWHRVDPNLAAAITAITVTLLRFGALRWNWTLPKA